MLSKESAILGDTGVMNPWSGVRRRQDCAWRHLPCKRRAAELYTDVNKRMWGK